MAILSVCLSRQSTRYRFKPGCDRDFGFPPYDSLESLVFCDKISCREQDVLSNEEAKDGHFTLKTLFYRYWLV